MKAIREYIASLSEEWQKKVDLRVNGGLDPCFSQADIKRNQDDLATIKENYPLDCEFKWTSNDQDLPEQASCGLIESCAAQINPGQLVLAMAEQIVALGGRIVTNCSVQKVINDNSGILKVACHFQDKDYVQSATNVVHCWNGYGQKDVFLPERLASKVQPARN